MANRLEAVIAQMVFRQFPNLTKTIRSLKEAGASKLTVRDHAVKITEGSDLLTHAVCVAIDYVWQQDEPKPTNERLDNVDNQGRAGQDIQGH